MDVEMKAANSVCPESVPDSRSAGRMRVLAVVPGESQDSDQPDLGLLANKPGRVPCFTFARRDIQALIRIGVDVQTFFLIKRLAPFGLFQEFLKLRRTIREYAPDIVHANYGTVTAFLTALASNRRLVISFRGSDLNPPDGVGRLRRSLGILLSQLAALRATAIVCVSARLRDRLWWRKGRATIVSSGVNLKLFKPMDQVQARRALGWHGHERVILFNEGGVPKIKGWDVVQEAVKVARKAADHIRLVVLTGDTPADQVPLYLNGADCLVLASQSEGSPNIVKEALACNLPVVAVDVGDVAERLAGVVPSRMVRRDAHEIGRAAAEILLLRRRSNGREKVLELSDDRVAEKLSYVYASALQAERGYRSPSRINQTMI